MLVRLGGDVTTTGLTLNQIDDYAAVASELMYVASGRQYRGQRDRTVVANVGRAHRGRAKASLGSWWPVHGVSDVVGLPDRRAPVPVATSDWAWSGGIALVVPAWLANQQVQALLTCGQAPPAAGKLAAVSLAVELILNDPDYDGDQESRLPALVTSISRQGVSQTFATVIDVLKEGATGIQEVDQFVAQVNPTKVKSRPRVRAMR